MAEPMVAFPVPPLVKQVELRLEPEEAFRRFTERIGSWWPMSEFSVSRDAEAACILEPRPGGRLLERMPDGKEALWGMIELWDPPNALAFSWHPGRDPQAAQRVHLRFDPCGDERTLVTLTHSGWEALGDAAAAARASYEAGWGKVLVDAYAAEFPVRKEEKDED